MYEAFQRAVAERLQSDLALMGRAPFYDYVPEDAPRPYITFTSAWTAERDGLNFVAERIWFQVSVWSDYRGFRELSEIGDRVIALLRQDLLVVDGFGCVRVLGDNSHLLRDSNPAIRHLALTFYCPFVAPFPSAQTFPMPLWGKMPEVPVQQ